MSAYFEQNCRKDVNFWPDYVNFSAICITNTYEGSYSNNWVQRRFLRFLTFFGPPETTIGFWNLILKVKRVQRDPLEVR